MSNSKNIHADCLNAKVAILLNQEHGQLPHLSPEQCYVVIETLERMQDDRDAEVYDLLKPSLDHLRAVITHVDMWKSLMSLPRSGLLKALSSHVKTDMGIKSRAFQLQGQVLMAIVASNEIYRALEVEKEASGLSKVLVTLKHEVKKMMDNIQNFLVDLMRHMQRSPSTAAVYFGPLKVGLRKGLPSYFDPDQKVLKTASSKHPLVKTAGSEWNKWFHRHDTKFIRVARNRDECYMKFYVPEGPILELREAFEAAEVTEQALDSERMSAQPLSDSQVKRDDATKTSDTSGENGDIEYLEDLEWDFTTYLKILDHKKVDYVQAEDDFVGREPDEHFYEDPLDVSDRELQRFLLPGYSGTVISRHERIFHPADIEIFENMIYDSNLPSIAAANGSLNTTILEDNGFSIGEIRDHVRHDANVPFTDRSSELGDEESWANSFSRDGLHLDRRSEMMRVSTLFFYPPEYQGQEGNF